MPHIVVEYSANIERQVDPSRLVQAVHQAVLSTGVFELGAIRTRAERRDIYAIADRDPANAFIHIGLRIAPGRDAETRRKVGGAIFDALKAETAAAFASGPLALSLEINEIDNTAAFRLNNLHERMKAKHGAKPNEATL